MKISELADRTGVPVATLKFYLRRRLLPPGRSVTRTLAEYDDTHVDRVRLIRALTEVGGLDLSSVDRVLRAVDGDVDSRLGLLGTAQRAIAGDGPADEGDSDSTSRVRAWLEDHDWTVDPTDPEITRLENAWRACDDAGIGLDGTRMHAYADAIEDIARVDVATVPADPAGAVRQVVLGTVLVDPVLASLRRLAHQNLSIRSQYVSHRRDRLRPEGGSTPQDPGRESTTSDRPPRTRVSDSPRMRATE